MSKVSNRLTIEDQASSACRYRWSRQIEYISNAETYIAIPFFAMKIDSSFLYLKKISRRITINTKLTHAICTKLRIMARHLRISTIPLSSLFSDICKRDTRKLKHASATISLPNHFGIPCLFSFSLRTISSISNSIKQIYGYLDGQSQSKLSVVVFDRNRKRTGVRHKITFKVLGPRNFVWSSSSPAAKNMVTVMGIKKTTR